MKKTLLSLGLVVAAGMGAVAQNQYVTEPIEMPMLVLTNVSENGKWLVSSDSYLMNIGILNMETQEAQYYGDFFGTEPYTAGYGHAVSDNGIVVASGAYDDMPYYWEDGEWYPLPLLDTDFGAFPNAITPDGRMIVGSVEHTAISLDADEVMTVPVVWYRNDEGGYDIYETLPYPKTDWTGRKPQYILVDDISADGNIIACDLHDHSGFYDMPMIIKKTDDGWEYEVIGMDLINPEGIELPEYPGEGPEEPSYADYMTASEQMAYEDALEEYNSRPYPNMTDFMTEEELDEYNAAYDAYWEDPNNNPYPQATDYMTDEEYEAYFAAVNEYYDMPYPDPEDYMTEEEFEAYVEALNTFDDVWEEWYELYSEWDDAYWLIMANAPMFEMNSTRISHSGRFLLMTAMVLDDSDPMAWFPEPMGVPYVFDLVTGANYAMDKGITDVYGNMVTDNGKVLGCTPTQDFTRDAVLSDGPDAPFVRVADLIKDTDAELYEWVEETMTHTMMEYAWNEETGEVDVIEKEALLMGTPISNNALDVLATWNYNNWDEESGVFFYSYVLPLKSATGINDITASAAESALTVSFDKKGVLTVNGAAKNIAIYDVNGRMVFNTTSPAATINTGLQRGAYIVKAVDAQGRNVVLKANI